jgi:hypothetical protein
LYLLHVRASGLAKRTHRIASTSGTTLNANRMPYLQIVVHVLHPPPSADSRQKGYPLPDFYSGATGNPAASVRDYCSGAYIHLRALLGHAGMTRIPAIQR